MEIGMIGLGRMGSSMVRRLLRAGHRCVVFDVHPQAVQAPVSEGAVGATSLVTFSRKRGEADFADKVLSAMRYAFGGHLEKPASSTGGAS